MEQSMQLQYLQELFETLSELSSNQGLHTYLVRNRYNGQLCIWKEIHPMSLNVYKKLQTIRHPNMAAVLSVVSSELGGIVIEEYISGQTLENLLQIRGKIEKEQALVLIRQLFSVLEALEKNELVHRDIQPQNLLISTDGMLKLIDFGIARIRREQVVTDTQLLGTVGYAAPEQFGFRQTDSRSDIYAAGMVFHTMLTGHVPQGGRCETEFYKGFICNCIEIDPSKRYGSVREAVASLESTKGRKLRPYAPIGFRTRKIWKEVLASFFYFLIGFFILFEFLTTLLLSPIRAPFNLISSAFLYVFSFIAATNCFDWYHRLPLFRKMGESWKVAMQIIMAILSLWIGVVLFTFTI